MSDLEIANHANMLNPEHPAYYLCRGYGQAVAVQMALAQREANQLAASLKKKG